MGRSIPSTYRGRSSSAGRHYFLRHSGPGFAVDYHGCGLARRTITLPLAGAGLAGSQDTEDHPSRARVVATGINPGKNRGHARCCLCRRRCRLRRLSDPLRPVVEQLDHCMRRPCCRFVGPPPSTPWPTVSLPYRYARGFNLPYSIPPAISTRS